MQRDFWDEASDVPGGAGQAVDGAAGKAWDSASNTAGGSWDTASGAAGEAWGSASNTAGGLWEQVFGEDGPSAARSDFGHGSEEAQEQLDQARENCRIKASEDRVTCQNFKEASCGALKAALPKEMPDWMKIALDVACKIKHDRACASLQEEQLSQCRKLIAAKKGVKKHAEGLLPGPRSL